MVDYPANFRLPEYTGYQYAIDMGVARSAGFAAPEQARLHDHMPHQFSMRIILANADAAAWFRWWIENAYSWFNMPVQSHHAADQNCSPLRVRCIGNIEMINSAVYGFVEMSFLLEHVE